jgi:hypothetical protein
VPTNQLQDFKSLFKRNSELWKGIDMASKTELVRLTKEKEVKHIVAFTVPLFRMITKTSKPGWRDLVKCAKHDFPTSDFPKDEDVEERRAKLSLGNEDDVDVYMGLDTRWKNVTNRKGERYFTLILDAIFERIVETK